MAVVYTTATLVRKATKWISPDLTDGDIDEFIYNAEGIIDGVMKQTGRGLAPTYTFDSTLHGLVRTAATNLALFEVIKYDVGSYPLLEQAEMTANLSYYSALRALTLLADVRVTDYVMKLT